MIIMNHNSILLMFFLPLMICCDGSGGSFWTFLLPPKNHSFFILFLSKQKQNEKKEKERAHLKTNNPTKWLWQVGSAAAAVFFDFDRRKSTRNKKNGQISFFSCFFFQRKIWLKVWNEITSAANHHDDYSKTTIPIQK